MTAKELCDKVRYRKRTADSKEMDPGKERKMFTVNRESHLYLESLGYASLSHQEWSFDSMCSDKIRLARKTVIKDVGLPE